MDRFKVTVDGNNSRYPICCYCKEELTWNPIANQYYHKAQKVWTWQELYQQSSSPMCEIRKIQQKFNIKPDEVMATTDVCPKRHIEWWLFWDGERIKPRMVTLGP